MSSIDNKSEFKTTLFSSPKTRREAMKSLSTGMTVAALSGCVSIRKPKQIIKTYTHESTTTVPGLPNYYATSAVINNRVNSLLATTYEGRPTKLDGHPDYPENNGRSSAHIQAEIQQLYDPDRLKTHTLNGDYANVLTIKNVLGNISLDDSTLLVLPNHHSMVIESLLKSVKKSHVFIVDPLMNGNQNNAIYHFTGQRGFLHYNFKKTKFILNFESDFLGLESENIASLQSYMTHQSDIMHVSVSSHLSMTDSKADRIINQSPSHQREFIKALAHRVITQYGTEIDKAILKTINVDTTMVDTNQLNPLVDSLLSHKSAAIVMVGAAFESVYHALALAINTVLKNNGSTVHIKPYSDSSATIQPFNDTIDAIRTVFQTNRIKTVISFGVDLPRFMPNFSDVVGNALIINVCNYRNALSAFSAIHIAGTHFLEEWGLLKSDHNHICIQQPVIEPLYPDVLSHADVLTALVGSSFTVYQQVQTLLKSYNQSFDQLKSKGFIVGKSLASLRINKAPIAFSASETIRNDLTLTVSPSYYMLDGRYANNAWLHETPDPITKLTWGNAFIINTDFAKKNHLVTGDVVTIDVADARLKGPVIILPGQNRATISINYGYGAIYQTTFSGYGISTDGLDPYGHYPIQSVSKTNEHVTLADTQMNHGLDEESLAASGIKDRIKNILHIKTIAELDHAHHDDHHIHSLFKEQVYTGEHQWGMSIDLNACIGCHTCAVACQAENNIPIVGKDEVIKGREMSWIRIDRYFIENDHNDVTINYMPVACVHCENAPCEQVCPVNATVHDDEGLNVMTYNRCIGTRYCANNCPYKVRRFNFFDWHQKNPQSVEKKRIHLFDYFREPSAPTQKQFNPEVTIRMRGVMEKCTYCIQRISHAKLQKKLHGTPIDGLQTACQQSCPTNAIVFGDINQKNHPLQAARSSKRRYDLLQNELNTKPRTVYLAKIKRSVWKETPHEHH
jgi:Fe-S-cluster-containing dehydrogenase component